VTVLSRREFRSRYEGEFEEDLSTLRNHTKILVVLFLISVVVLIPSVWASSNEPPKYWFEVGAFAAEPEARFATGASVEINVQTEQSPGLRYFWVGLSFPNSSFVQAGYTIGANSAAPRWFWAYFPPGVVTESSDYVMRAGYSTIPLGWTKFIITGNGATWSFYMNQSQIGQVTAKAADSGNNAPGAIAENAGTTRITDPLGPVEFRNLQYRSRDGSWHSVKIGKPYVGYSVLGSKLPDGVQYPYGIGFEPGKDNYWLAGTNFSSKVPTLLWPWYHVEVNAPYGHEINMRSGSRQGEWYAFDSMVEIQIPMTQEIAQGEQSVFSSWQTSSSSLQESQQSRGHEVAVFLVRSPLQINATYKKQFELTITSSRGQTYGAGWYDQGATANFSVYPTKIAWNGPLGAIGVGYVPSGWQGNYQGAGSSGTVIMDSPKSVQAVWKTDYGFLPMLVLVLLISCFGLVWLLAVAPRRKQSQVTCASVSCRRSNLQTGSQPSWRPIATRR
jgi:hypothetical protein